MKLQENLTTELKRVFVDEVKKTVIAFANTDGGKIYLGVEDDGTAIGINDLDETMLKCTNAIREGIRPDVGIFCKCRTETYEQKKIVVIEVQKGTASPYYLSAKGLRPEGVFVRQGSSSVPASETAILKMIKETDGNDYESIRSLNQDLTFEYAAKVFDRNDLELGTSQMKTLGIINNESVFSNLGLLISDQTDQTIKLAVFEGTDKRIFKDRFEFTGSLLKQLDDVYATLNRYNRTKADFKDLYREDKRDYPVEALREVLLNTIIHRDYSIRGSSLISIFDDRIEFISLGGLVKGISYDDIMLGVSVLRNKQLGNLFYRLNLIEAYGTGLPKIRSCYAESSVKPIIEISQNAFKVTLPNLNNSVEKENDALSTNEQEGYKLFVKDKILTRKQIEENLKISQPSAVNLLNSLVRKKLIRRVEKGKNTKYKIN